MGNINSTIWEIEPHTEAKHAILRKYLDAWLPIITRWNGRVLYIDGFAGPGEYVGGKDGSPIIAIKAVLEHHANISSEIIMKFIESDQNRCDFLKNKINNIQIPTNIKVECICKRFDEVLSQIFNFLDEQKARLAPPFVFIDPFGFTGIPLNLIKRIMENGKCEILITFMYEEINRFAGDDRLANSLNETFGTDTWRQVDNERDPQKRASFLHNIYKDQLVHEAGIKFVQSFKMINKANKIDYFIFFGTNNTVGLKKMKEAMWNVDESGAFHFSDATYNPMQSILFETMPNFSDLKKIILEHFSGRVISVQELENFIITQTPYRETHYKRQILAPMEKAEPPEIEVTSLAPHRRKGTYPNDCIVKFVGHI